MKLLDEALSLNVQMTSPKAYLAESLPAGVEELMRLYIDPSPPGARAAFERKSGDSSEDADRI